MKPYTVSIDIELPRQKVVELFDNPDHLKKWQKGFQSFEPLSGEPGQPGAKSKLVYRHGKRIIELIETVTERRLPDEFNGTYEWKGGMNSLHNQFHEIAPDRTRWVSTCEYQFKSRALKIMGTLAPGLFKKQNMSFLEAFKAFAETGADINHGPT